MQPDEIQSDTLAVLQKECPLPVGWRYEASHDADVIHLCWQGHGAMTLNMKRKTYAMGWCAPLRGSPSVSGRGWKEALIQMAVKTLQDVYAPHHDVAEVA